MLANPPVLLLDEPTRSLDPIAAARMRSTIRSLARGQDSRVTVFLTSHNLSEVEELCDRVAVIAKGRIRALDTPKNLRSAHTESENVTVTFTSSYVAQVERALVQVFSSHSFNIEDSSGDGKYVLKFSRAVDDEKLDLVLRVLQGTGAVIRAEGGHLTVRDCGFFDSDGSVQSDQKKGVSVRLAQSDLPRLQAVQRMLLRLGIASAIYANRRPAGSSRLPDGRGRHAEYVTKPQHELVITNDNLVQFEKLVGFADGDKAARLKVAIASYRRTINRERFVATVTSVTPDGMAMGRLPIRDMVSTPGRGLRRRRWRRARRNRT